MAPKTLPKIATGMMMVHHQGAVVMAQEALNKSKHAEIKQMAPQMIADQQRENAAFQTHANIQNDVQFC